MTRVQKWDFEGRVYRPYEIPADWFCVLYSPNMDTVINYASCGKKLTFGDGYTSRCIHNATGFGYTVCAECYSKEWAAERAARKEQIYENQENHPSASP